MNSFRRWLSRSLARRITILVSVLLLAVGAGICGVSYLQVLRASRRVMAERLELVGQQLASTLGRSPGDVRAKLRRLAADPAILDALESRGDAASTVAESVLQRGAVASPRGPIALTDSRGTLVLQAGTPDLSWFGPAPGAAAAALDDTAVTVGSYLRHTDSLLYYDIRAPVRRGDSTIGALYQRGRLAMSPNARETFAWLLGSSTSLILGAPASGFWTDLGSIAPAPPLEALQTDQVHHVNWGGTDFVAYSIAIQNTPWILILRAPNRVVTAPAREFLERAAILAALLVLLGAFGGWVIGRRLIRPIEAITEVSEAIAAGDHSERASESGSGEIGRLGRSFNTMVDRVTASSRRLEESEASLRAFVTHSSQGIWRLDFADPVESKLSPERQIGTWYAQSEVSCNQALLRMYGVETPEEFGSLPLDRLFPPDDPSAQRLLKGFIENGYRCSGVETHEARGDQVARVFVNDLVGILENGGLKTLWGNRRDVTLERLVEERITQTQRMESIGRVAGGVAHDFNNLLTAILGYAEDLMERLPEGDPTREDAVQIHQIVGRAGELSRQLLAFSRGQVLKPTLVDLNAVVRSSQGILHRVLGEDIELRVQLTEPLDAVEVDAGQIERVIMNLIVNARDAMPNGGRLEVRTALIEVEDDLAMTRADLRPGRYVALIVSDSGIGMTEDVKRHAFEPFFSTKPTGKGNGLGLATVYGIVRQSGGDVTLYSEIGLGTTFRILLPARCAESPVPAQSAPQTHASPVPRGAETVLLVEDEPTVRDIARRALTAAGYTVLQAPDGAEALRIAEAEPRNIDLLLTDMVMPGMNGRQLARELRRLRPCIRVIIMSGYTGATHPALEARLPDEGYLEKPFSATELRRKVREVLDAPVPEPALE